MTMSCTVVGNNTNSSSKMSTLLRLFTYRLEAFTHMACPRSIAAGRLLPLS
jgi:hypothetical protein